MDSDCCCCWKNPPRRTCPHVLCFCWSRQVDTRPGASKGQSAHVERSAATCPLPDIHSPHLSALCKVSAVSFRERPGVRALNGEPPPRARAWNDETQLSSLSFVFCPGSLFDSTLQAMLLLILPVGDSLCICGFTFFDPCLTFLHLRGLLMPKLAISLVTYSPRPPTSLECSTRQQAPPKG